MKLLTTANAKTIKGEKKGWLTGILYLAPCTIATDHNVCPNASPGCSDTCLYTAGRGGFSNVQQSRINKTQWLFEDRKGFIEQLCRDIESLERTAKRRDMRPVVRLNGTSDISWESKAFGRIPQQFPQLWKYDYTKAVNRVLRKEKPTRYSLVFSRTENNDAKCQSVLGSGFNVAVVFDEVPVGKKFWHCTVLDGDADDLRFLDKQPAVVGLKAKGKARKDTSGFVVRAKEL
jgi:hypothetical protein